MTNTTITAKLKKTLNKLIPTIVRQAHHERNQPLTVRPEPVEGLNQNSLKAWLNSWGKVILLFAFVGLMFNQGLHKTPKIAPDINFVTMTGKSIQLSALRGKPVIVNFWATSCPSCIKEIPMLIDLHQRYHAQGLEMIAIAMAYDPPNLVLEMMQNKSLPYDVTLDVTGEFAKAFGGVQAIPATFVIAANGKIVKRELGVFDLAKMEQHIQQLLKN